MNLKIEIKRNATGLMVSDVWQQVDFNDYIWSEGNFACDCNRESFFLQWHGESTKDDIDECGDDRFSVRLSDADTGEVLYDEFEN